MSFWGESAASSCNPSLAWVMGSGGKGRIIIQFPFTLESGWYREQPCTKFRVFQHRKERKGLQHEFIVLVLLDGSVCRVERMGDPNARFDALSPLGTIAHDMAQSFRPSDIGQACLESSDLISEVKLPCDFDIMDVLKICRAIHEGEKTRNYTLQIYNCWFFSLAIQVCLTRLVAHWEDQELLGIWLSQVNKAVGLLTNTDRSPQATIPILDRQIFSQIYSILHPQNDDYGESFVNDVKLQFESRIATGLTIVQQVTYRVNNLLWYSTINSSLNDFIEEESHNAIMHILRKRFLIAPALDFDSQSLEGLKSQLLSNLVVLLELAGHTRGRRTVLLLQNNNLKHKIVDVIAAEHGSETRTTELKFSGVPLPQTINPVEPGWHPRALSCLQWLGRLLLWLLNAILSTWGINLLSPRIDLIPCVVVDHRLENVLTKLGCLDTIEHSDLEEFIKELGALVGNKAAIWDNSPWNCINEFIRGSIPEDILEGMELHKPKLNCWINVSQKLNEQPLEQSKLDISTFQRHILGRIKIHAREVEKNWLGSAASIQVELEGVLSRVWETIREESSETQKAEHGPRRYIPSPYKRKVLLIGAPAEDDFWIEHDFASLASIFKQRSFMVETLTGDWFDANILLQWVQLFLRDANEGDIRIIIFAGHTTHTQTDRNVAIIPPSGRATVTENPDEGLISADTWRETVDNNVQPGVVVVSIFAVGGSGSFMSQPSELKDCDSVALIEPVHIPPTPIFITLASAQAEQSSYESVVGPSLDQDDPFRYGDHFLRALTLALESRALDWNGFIQDLEEKFSQLRMIGAYCAAHDPDVRDSNWLETHPQIPVYSSSHLKLPDFEYVFPWVTLLPELRPATAHNSLDFVNHRSINLTEQFLAYISCVGETPEITHYTLPSAP